MSGINLIFKYADDTNLLVPENTDVDLKDEHITALNTGSPLTKCVSMIVKVKNLFFIDLST